MAPDAKRSTTPGEPLYVQLAKLLEAEILQGFERSNRLRLPPERQLASMFGVSRITVRAALQALSVRWPLQKRVGAGVFVQVSEVKGGAALLLRLPAEAAARGLVRASGAFSSEVASGSREENALKQISRAPA